MLDQPGGREQDEPPEVAADLHESQSFGVVDLLSQGIVFEVAGKTRKASLRAASGRPAAAAQAMTEETPGTTVIRRRRGGRIHE